MFIRKAERKKVKLRLGLYGASGSGKTYSALEIATGMGGKICMIDTESGRGNLYGKSFDYDVLELEIPYSPERYIEAIKKIQDAKYDIIIIDSLSHAWTGEGGVLSIVEKAGGNTFTNGWRIGTPRHNALINAITTSKCHIIATMRSKSDTVVEINERGKAVPREVGLKPIQRDEIKFELDINMAMDQDHIAHFTKDVTNLYGLEYVKPDKSMGEKLMEWLNDGIDAKEHFISTVLPIIFVEIEGAQNIIQLTDTFTRFYKQWKDEFPDEAEQIKAKASEKKKQFTNDGEYQSAQESA